MILKVKENLELRTLIPENGEEVFNVIDKNRKYLRKWLPWLDSTKSPDNVKETIEKWQKELENKIDYVFGIFLDGNYVGNISVHDVDKNNNSAMIGYWLAADYQGRGIMTECVRTLVNFCFHEIDLNRVYIYCAFGNNKSRAIPERLGFVHEGILQESECLCGVYHDLVVYGIVKRNWKNIK